jgi:hypothetical protein
MLRTLILDSNNNACGQVSNTNSTAGSVGVLATCATCSVGVYSQILTPHLNINLQFRQLNTLL